MNTLTYNLLVEKLAFRIRELDILIGAMSIKASIFDMILRGFHMVYKTWRTLRIISKIDQEKCTTCDNLDCITSLKDNLESMVHGYNKMRKKKKEMGFPFLLFKIEDYIISQIEDKLENYWIASDKEITDLASSVSKKMNKIHAIH